MGSQTLDQKVDRNYALNMSWPAMDIIEKSDFTDLEQPNGIRSRLVIILGPGGNLNFQVITFDEQLRPIYAVLKSDDLKKAFREIVQGYHFLFHFKDRIRHRDISLENLMVRDINIEGGVMRGVLSDWDLAQLRSSPGTVPKGTRTGTLPFMSLDLLEEFAKTKSNENDARLMPDHIERFDWESMFYVLYWIACNYDKGKSVKRDDLTKKWFGSEPNMLFDVKQSLLFKADYKIITAQFRPLLYTWIVPFRKHIAAGYTSRRDCIEEAHAEGKEVIFDNNADAKDKEIKFDNETLDGHITYEKLWPILQD